MIALQKVFNIQYGHGLELNKLDEDNGEINFISRTAKNNGVSAIVRKINSVKEMPEGSITVSLGGTVLEAFLQPKPYYTGYHIFCLLDKDEIKLTKQQKLFYCACIRENKYRYSYGRQANKTLKNILVPAPQDIPSWVNGTNLDRFDELHKPFSKIDTPSLSTKNWKSFHFDDIFEIKKGKRLTKENMIEGGNPFVGAIDKNNGISNLIGQTPLFDSNTITVSYNGSVAEAFYQPYEYWASDDINILIPRFEITPFLGLFLCTVIKKEKYRFSYGRKWHKERMQTSTIKLPVDKNGKPDWQFMEDYIKSLPYSANI